MSSIEIEIPRKLIKGLWAVVALIGLTVAGFIVSPESADGRPLLLTPRLAQLSEYQQDVREWVGDLRQHNADLEYLLEDDNGDLFAQDSQASRIYGKLLGLAETIESTEPPAGLEGLHVIVHEAAAAHLKAAAAAGKWISEPISDNLAAAETALGTASETLTRIYQNPWYDSNGR